MKSLIIAGLPVQLVGFSGAAFSQDELNSLEDFRKAAKFDTSGEKIMNAKFEKVAINGVVVHEGVELSGPTRGTISSTEVVRAPYRLHGGPGQVAFRNIHVTDLSGGAL